MLAKPKPEWFSLVPSLKQLNIRSTFNIDSNNATSSSFCRTRGQSYSSHDLELDQSHLFCDPIVTSHRNTSMLRSIVSSSLSPAHRKWVLSGWKWLPDVWRWPRALEREVREGQSWGKTRRRTRACHSPPSSGKWEWIAFTLGAKTVFVTLIENFKGQFIWSYSAYKNRNHKSTVFIHFWWWWSTLVIVYKIPFNSSFDWS